MQKGTLSARPFSREFEGPEWDRHVFPLQGPVPSGKTRKTFAENNKKAKVLWAMKEAKGEGVDYYDTNHHKEIQTRAQFRLN